MSTVIRNDSDLFRTLNIYGNTTNGMQKSMLKISSGLRINSAGDDPSGWVVSKRMLEQISSTDQAEMNVQTDTSMIRVAEASISNTVEIIHTLRARAINSANDHNTEDAREIIQYEAKQLLNQIDNNSKVAFNGKKLLDGSQSLEGLNFHVGGEANFSITVKLADMSIEGLGLGGLDLSTREGALAALGVRLDDGTYADSGTVTDPETGEKIYGMLDEALRRALSQQSMLGALEEGLGFTSDNLLGISENMTAANGVITDADIAKEMAHYVKLNILSQSAQYILAQINQNAASVLDLLAPVQ